MSIGYTILDPNEPTTTRLFRDGDRGLYRAKELGRGRAATVSGSSAAVVAVDITDQPVWSGAGPDH